MKTKSNPNVGNGSDSEHSLPLLVGGTEALESELSELIEQWERRLRTAEDMARKHSASFDISARDRCATKAGMIRNMIVELKRAISTANVKAQGAEPPAGNSTESNHHD